MYYLIAISINFPAVVCSSFFSWLTYFCVLVLHSKLYVNTDVFLAQKLFLTMTISHIKDDIWRKKQGVSVGDNEHV